VGYESGHALSRVTLRPDGPSSSPTSRERIKPGARLRAGTAQESTEAGDDAQEAREQLLEALGAEADEEDDGGGEPR